MPSGQVVSHNTVKCVYVCVCEQVMPAHSQNHHKRKLLPEIEPTWATAADWCNVTWRVLIFTGDVVRSYAEFYYFKQTFSFDCIYIERERDFFFKLLTFTLIRHVCFFHVCLLCSMQPCSFFPAGMCLTFHGPVYQPLQDIKDRRTNSCPHKFPTK